VDAAAIAREFDLGAGARLSDGPVARGRMGLVWRLETADRRWAVKVPFGPATEADAHEAAVLQETAWAAGVPTPEVRRTTAGTVFGTVAGTRLRVYEWVDLLPPDPLADPAAVGAAVGALHRVSPATPDPPDPWSHAPVGAARWDELVRLLDGEGAPFAHRLAGLRDELVALESWLAAPAVVRLCHGDLWADNVVPTAEGGVCVIDWENCHAADPSHELALVVFEFGRTDPGRVRSLLEAYDATGGTGRVRERGDFTMLVAQLGHITETAAADWLQPNPRTPDRADAEAWVSEVFDDPHTREVLDRLLATCRAR